MYVALLPLLSVFDMPTRIKFYCEGLGFEVVQLRREAGAAA